MLKRMTNLDASKKPASKGSFAPSDWHKADIKAALEKRGLSLGKLGRLNGYSRTAPAHALRFPWPKMEKLIADALGLPPQQIWPTRYHADGRSKSGRGERGIGRYKAKSTRSALCVTVQNEGGK